MKQMKWKCQRNKIPDSNHENHINAGRDSLLSRSDGGECTMIEAKDLIHSKVLELVDQEYSMSSSWWAGRDERGWE